MQVLQSEKQPAEILKNIPALLNRNIEQFEDNIAFREKKKGRFEGIAWKDLYEHINNIAFNLKKLGFQSGDKMVLFSENRLEMLELELAIMSIGGIAVPIFSGFKKDTAELLINHSGAKWLAVSGMKQLSNLSDELKVNMIIVFDEGCRDEKLEFIEFKELLRPAPGGEIHFNEDIDADAICLNMYTSGTMGTPKCVQLTHKNILSQQAALEVLWDVDQNDRFLSYLPWHHSFGGIFELFTALYNGAAYSLESSYGKDPESIFENWKLIKPTVFLSVPKVYQSLFELAKESKEAEDAFFNSGLKFIFTAAAPLPEKLSNEFEKRGIPVIEGWGLTETSPCCTLTDPSDKRETGIVGKPIPGVKVRIADDDEIQIQGPNVMVSYFNNDEANAGAFTDDGWYRTGDVGKITDKGLKLISRKDRIFKLSNGEKVIPTDLEKQIEKRCHYVKYAVVSGSGEKYPVALVFPNKKLFNNPDYEITPEEGCFCPRSINELGKCFSGCLQIANEQIGQKFAKVKAAAIIDDELSVEDNTLTPSLKMAPKNVIDKYKRYMHMLYGDTVPEEEEVFLVELNPKNLS